MPELKIVLSLALTLQRTKTEQAIGVLQDEYREKLEIKEVLASIQLLKSNIEAGIFLTLKPGPLQDI
jgi:hypothetical protein